MVIKDKVEKIISLIDSPVLGFIRDNVESCETVISVDVSDNKSKVLVEDSSGTYEMKIGRFINKIADNSFTPRDIELFVNEYKSIYAVTLGGYSDRITIGKGEDVKWSYETINYYDTTGSLGGSCMNNVEAIRLKIYSDNPRKVKIIMLKHENGKLLGRAILWDKSFIRVGDSADDRNSNESVKTGFLDRVYAVNESTENIIRLWARSKGYYVRMGGMSVITPDGRTSKARIKCKLKNLRYLGDRPYLDTMGNVSPNGTFSNKRWKDDNMGNGDVPPAEVIIDEDA